MNNARPSTYRFLLALLGSHRYYFVPVVLLGILAQITNIVNPYVARKLIDSVDTNRDATLIRTLVAVSIALIACTIIWRNAQAFCSHVLRMQLQRGLTNRLYAQIMGQSMDFFRSHGVGEISGRFQTLRSSLVALVSGFQSISNNLGFLVLIPPLLFSINAKLAAIAISIIPATAYLTYKQCSGAYCRVKEYVEQTAENDEFQTSTLVGIRSLKGLNVEEYCSSGFQARNAKSAHLQRRNHRIHTRYSLATSALKALSLSLCTLLGWHLVFTKALTLGQFIAFMAYVNYLYSPLQTVIEALSSVQEAAVSLETPLEFMSRPPEAHTWLSCVPPSLPIRASPREVSVHNVRFGYAGGSIIFDALNATFSRGTTAIVGHNGCGKTTLLHLLSGLHTPLEGAVTFGGLDIRHISWEDVRAQVSVVWQDSWVLPGSLWENLVMDQIVGRREVERVIEVCQMGELMSNLPDSYNTRLGAGGVVFSAGQRQLLSIARALLRKTPILLLDEATANIDLAIESKLLQSLMKECRDRVTVVTTHRAAPAMLADRVLVCRRGLLEDVTTTLKSPLSVSRNGDAANATDERMRALLHEHEDVPEDHREGQNVEVR
jgi:ABC-type bacteriocin/lantibiotic exporter with double-glycine peptidase domain